MNEWCNDISYYCIFLLFSIKVQNYNPLNESENNERYEIKSRIMFMQRSEGNIWLVCWEERSQEPEALTYSWLKGIVHINIIFSCMKFNQICNLDHLVY